MTPPTAPVPPHGALLYVAAVNLVIWAGLFGYLLYLDAKLRTALKDRGPTSTAPVSPRSETSR